MAVGAARRLTLLFLHNALLARTAAALGAPKLSALLLPLIATDCPHMQCAALLLCMLTSCKSQISFFCNHGAAAGPTPLQRCMVDSCHPGR